MSNKVDAMIRKHTLGGPGLDGYAYCADTYCPECGADIIGDVIRAAVNAGVPVDSFDGETDSERIPQPIFFGDADRAVHCADCGSFMYGEDSEDA